MRAIYCAGEQGRVVLDILRSVDEDDVVFADDDANLHDKSVAGRPVVGGLDHLANKESVTSIVAYGDQPGVRLELADSLSSVGCDFFNAVHDSATISDTASLGNGVMINAESYIAPNAEIGDHVLIDSCVNISHDVCLGRGATITPGATIAGGVVLSTDSYVGPGSTVIEDITINEGAIVGAGAVVTDDVPADTTVVGVPASPIDS